MKRLIWKIIGISCVALWQAAAGTAVAQETAEGAKPKEPDRVPESIERLLLEVDEESLKEVPKRDYKVEQGPPQQTRLFRADPKLLENKFVATMVFLPSGLNPADEDSVQRHEALRETDQNWSRALPEALQRLRELDNVFLFLSDVYQGGRPRAGASRPTGLSQHHALLVEQCPPEHRPDQRLTAFLTSTECDRDIVRRSNSRTGPQLRYAEWTYNIYAPTSEDAQQRAAAILRLFDWGLSRPMQRYLLAEGRKSLEAARGGYDELAKQNADISALQGKLVKPTEITPDILTQLKAQKVMVAIEMAGLNARVKACNEMLKDARDDTRPSPLQSSISDMKVRAEVELVGIKEKLDRINAYIAEGDERQALRAKIEQLQGARSATRSRIRQHEQRAQDYARLISLYAPLQLKDNQITISPVEWTN